ncbi:transglycosylase SLT domain-containing protein [Pseudomonadota bacterium]
MKLGSTGIAVLFLSLFSCVLHAAESLPADPLEKFSTAWRAAAHGSRADFVRLMPELEGYLLYPYLRYEDLRFRRTSVPADEMSAFIEEYRDWAFTPGLERAWLRTLGERSQWDTLLNHAPGVLDDTEVSCYLAQARIKRGKTDDLVPVAQSLWAVGKSQPDACDPVFRWLKNEAGITSGLAWERIRRAMEARQPKLTLYLARYLSPEDKAWADRWYQLDRSAYRQLKQSAKWAVNGHSLDITAYGLRRLARSDPDRAWDTYLVLESRFDWGVDVQGSILREIALWSAVEGLDGAPKRLAAVPEGYRDGKLWEWWARYNLSAGNWQEVISAIEGMPEDQRDDSRWRYWDARARRETGEQDQSAQRLADLALEANYYGFLAADVLDLPYTICPEEPNVTQEQVQALRDQPGFQRALELRRAGIPNWSRSEWKIAAKPLDKDGLRAAAAIATGAGWPDMAIFALGNSGDLRWYDWRFPIEYADLVENRAEKLQLDSSWVMGLMRSESAMAEDALSPAGARGLMQVMPGTAKLLARQHSFKYTGHQQLMQADDNIRFGTAYLRDLLDRFGDNEVLVSGAYNAGPHVVDRWMAERQTNDPAIFVETLPYFETRDYIPRVLAFSTIYDWRLQNPVRRISSRMPALDASPAALADRKAVAAKIVCRAPG